MSFALREHTADVAVEATGESLDAVFGAVADGMAAAMCDDIPEADGERFDFTVAAESGEALLFDYLDELIYERDVRGVLPVDNEAAVSAPSSDGERTGEWTLSGSARGIALGSVEARDLKAVTYSEMDLSETADGWHAYVVFDV
ncbi:archease [Halosimplex rubrum]|uniref:Archease n=1 Tax=Halosimplex rubrum TaxID=869889 RepID=A0A7D5P1V0_9EURY|nr:archease [Halosimplex rubrum]QLH78597.1 archease [Halosimplex rubrum]